MNGTLSTTLSRSAIQSLFDNFTEPEQFEEPTTAAGNLLRYTRRSFPVQLLLNESNVKMVHYYDGYDWVNDAELDFEQYSADRWPNAKGLATGSLVRRLDTGAWMKTVLYYDDQNRLIQTQTRNRYGSVNRTDVVMDFEGKVHETRTVYRRPGESPLSINTLYTYDHAGRQTSVKHRVNGTETPIAKYEYDEIGRLSKKHLGVADGRDIIIENSPQPDGDRDIAFRYVELLPGTYTAENGSYLTAIAPGLLQTIDYSYTLHGRLRGINLDAAEDYSMPGIGYDANGNLEALNRKGLLAPGVWGSIDILDFQFTDPIGNKPDQIIDYGSMTVGFKDNGGFGTDFSYYPDGSLKSDANKGISLIEYNYLGLEEKVYFQNGQRIENIYDAEGVKLEQRLISGGQTHSTEYIGDLIFVNGRLSTILHDEGRVKVEGAGRRYQFFMTDHLGNTRIIIERINDTTALVQENHYGVWGEPLIGLELEGDWNFLFQGKEYIDFEDYNLYDFHSRNYDPWAGRFWQIDGADQFASEYIGMGNNPLSYVDPDGQFVIVPILLAIGKAVAIGAAIGGISYTANVGFSEGSFSNWNWGQFGRSVGIGAVGGAVSFGIGSVAGAIGGVGGFAVQTAGHAAWGGVNSMWNGGDFWSGALSGGVGNIVGGITSNMGVGVQIGTSALMGGISADMAGGDFWRGFATGATVAGANHLMHDPPGSMKKRLLNYEKELLANAPKLDPITDVLGIADYYINGRRVGNILYDINGNPVSTDFSSYGAPDLIGGKSIGKGLKFTKHAVNQAISRGFKTNDILKIIREGSAGVGIGRYGPQMKYTMGGNTVVVNMSGRIVTVYSNSVGSAKGIGKGYFKLF